MSFNMKFAASKLPRGFTLIETVIAIGVLAVLLTAFMLVFTPAAEGIKKSISVQTADRMASTLENELVNLRTGEATTGTGAVLTGFDKAFKIIEASMASTPQVIFVYQYRGDLKGALRADGTMPVYTAKGGKAGEDYTVVTMARRRITLSDSTTVPNFQEDLGALEGRIFAVKMVQLVFSGGQLVENSTGKIQNPSAPSTPLATVPANGGVSDTYPEAVIAFSASFYGVPSSSYDYLKQQTPEKFDSKKLKNPYFTRNLAVRR